MDMSQNQLSELIPYLKRSHCPPHWLMRYVLNNNYPVKDLSQEKFKLKVMLKVRWAAYLDMILIQLSELIPNLKRSHCPPHWLMRYVLNNNYPVEDLSQEELKSNVSLEVGWAAYLDLILNYFPELIPFLMRSHCPPHWFMRYLLNNSYPVEDLSR